MPPTPTGQVGTHPNDARYMDSDAAILRRLADIRRNRGLPADPASDRIWLSRIKSGGATVFGQARTAMEQKAVDLRVEADRKLAKPEGPGKSPTPDSGAAPEVEDEPLDYKQYAPPWMTGPLLDIFVDEWAATGDANLAMAKLRRSPVYDQTFVGNRREDGSLRYSEGEYLATRDAFVETMAEYQLAALDKASIEQLFRGDVSAQEFVRAVDAGYQTFTEPGAGTPPELMDAYMQGFIGTGSASAAMEAARNSGAYDSVFAGNRREDGSLRMAEQDYFAYKRGWQRTLVNYGLNPTLFEGKGRFVEAVEGELSIDELNARIDAQVQGIESNIDQVREFYATGYGIELTRESILGAVIDPDIGRDLIERRITAAQVGGEAALQGFARSVERAEQLARAGLTQQQARGLYAEAGERVPVLDTLAGRHNDRQGEFGVGGFEEAQVLGDAGMRRRMERRLQDETSSFTGRSDTRRDQQTGALSGLRQR